MNAKYATKVCITGTEIDVQTAEITEHRDHPVGTEETGVTLETICPEETDT
jgi:hypothetical protein